MKITAMHTRMLCESISISTGMTICITNTTTQAYNSRVQERMNIRTGA